MHKKLLNELTLSLTISAEGPVLVKSGTETWDPAIPDMQFVRTLHGEKGETIFIPGSSIKGVLRSYSEKIARTLNVNCCDPFHEKDSCSKRLESIGKENNARAIYSRSCAACKLYGSTVMAGRAAFADAYPRGGVMKNLTKRTAVAIDRVLGSVAVGPFDFEALVNGDFDTTIRLRNFELWQLGLVGLAVRDLCLGRVRIGYGKSRGFGSVSARLDKLELRSLVPEGLEQQGGRLLVRGIGALLGDDAEQYGIDPRADEPAAIETTHKPQADLIGAGVMFELQVDSTRWCAPEVEALFTHCVKSAWSTYVAGNQVRGGRDE